MIFAVKVITNISQINLVLLYFHLPLCQKTALYRYDIELRKNCTETPQGYAILFCKMK